MCTDRETNSHLIPSIIRQARIGEILQLGNLQTRRDYIYVEDVVDAMLMLIDSKRDDQEEMVGIFNVGTGVEHSAQEVVKTLEMITNKQYALLSAPELERKSDRMHLLANSSKLRRQLGWAPTYDLEQGLRHLWRTGWSGEGMSL